MKLFKYYVCFSIVANKEKSMITATFPRKGKIKKLKDIEDISLIMGYQLPFKNFEASDILKCAFIGEDRFEYSVEDVNVLEHAVRKQLQAYSKEFGIPYYKNWHLR